MTATPGALTSWSVCQATRAEAQARRLVCRFGGEVHCGRARWPSSADRNSTFEPKRHQRFRRLDEMILSRSLWLVPQPGRCRGTVIASPPGKAATELEARACGPD